MHAEDNDAINQEKSKLGFGPVWLVPKVEISFSVSYVICDGRFLKGKFFQ